MKNSKYLSLIGLLVLVLAVRLGFLGLFHHQVFSGASTQFEQAFVAMNLADGKGIKIFKEFSANPRGVGPTRIIDPERYEIRSPEPNPTSGSAGLCLFPRWTLEDLRRETLDLRPDHANHLRGLGRLGPYALTKNSLVSAPVCSPCWCLPLSCMKPA